MKSIAKFLLGVVIVSGLFCGLSTPVATEKAKQLLATSMPFPKPIRPIGT